MAYPADQTATGGWESQDFADSTTGVFVRDVSPIFLEVLRRTPTLMGHFKTGQAAKNIEVEWFDRDWVPFRFTDTTTDTTNNTTDVAAVADETVGGITVANWFEEGDLFMIVGSGDGTLTPKPEIFQVVSISSSTVTLDRQYGGSTNAGVIDASGVGGIIYEKLGPVTPEHSIPSSDKTHGQGPSTKNYTQIFSYDLSVSGTSQQIETYHMNDYFGTNLKELTEELKLQLERISIYGLQHGTTPKGSDSVARTMNGLKYYLNRSGGNRITSGYTAPTEQLINTMCRQITEKNGQLNSRKGILACSPANAEIIADIWKDKIQINREDTVRGVQVKTIITKLGFSLDVVWDHNIHNNDLFILNPTKIEIAPLRGRAWFVKRYDNGADGTNARVIGEWTMRVFDSLKDHAVCTCLETVS